MLIESGLRNQLHRGKVRDTYAVNDNVLLMVATDRISAFDVVLPTGIPEKGKVLNRISGFWFDKTAHIVPNHLITLADSADAPALLAENPGLDRDFRRPGQPGHDSQAGPAHRYGVQRPGLHHGFRLV